MPPSGCKVRCVKISVKGLLKKKYHFILSILAKWRCVRCLKYLFINTCLALNISFITGMLAAEAAMDLIISGEATHDKGVTPTQYVDKLNESYVYKELKVS